MSILRPFATVATSLIIIGLCLGGCDKLDNTNFTVTVNGKSRKVKGLKGLKELVMGKKKPSEGQADDEKGGGGTGAEAIAEAQANGGTLQDRRRAPKPPMAPAAEAVDMALLAARRPSKKARALIGNTVLCEVTGVINRETVGDRLSKRGVKFAKGTKIGTLYAKLSCRNGAAKKKPVIVVGFLPTELAPSIDWLRMGGQVNIKLLGHTRHQWFGLIQGIVSTPSDNI